MTFLTGLVKSLRAEEKRNEGNYRKAFKGSFSRSNRQGSNRVRSDICLVDYWSYSYGKRYLERVKGEISQLLALEIDVINEDSLFYLENIPEWTEGLIL